MSIFQINLQFEKKKKKKMRDVKYQEIALNI